MAMGSAGSLGGAERHGRDEPGRREPPLCRFGARGQARPGRSGAPRSRPPTIPGAHSNSVHQMRLLHALPQRCEHSSQLRPLQLCPRLRGRGIGEVPLQPFAQRRRARSRLHRLRHLRSIMPAAHCDLRLDAEGGRVAGVRAPLGTPISGTAAPAANSIASSESIWEALAAGVVERVNWRAPCDLV